MSAERLIEDSLNDILEAARKAIEFVDEIGPPNANTLGNGLQYPRRTAANYEGGSWYLRAAYNF